MPARKSGLGMTLPAPGYRDFMEMFAMWGTETAEPADPGPLPFPQHPPIPFVLVDEIDLKND